MEQKRFRKEETVTLTGKIKWCKHLRPDPLYNKWSVVMYIEGKELDKVREWQAQGIKNVVKNDPNEGWYITLSRKTSIEVKGRVVGLEPPRVVDRDDKPITDAVGNGSDGVALCQLWTFNPAPGISGKALRWEGLRVDNLVPYTVKNDWPDQGESIKDLKNVPEQLF